MPQITGAADRDLIEQSAQSNEVMLRGLVDILTNARAHGISTDFAQKNRDDSREFNLRRYMLSKRTSTGRFGAREESTNDYIDALDGAEDTPQGKYFDPFSLKIITDPDYVPKEQTEQSVNIPTTSSGISTGANEIELSELNAKPQPDELTEDFTISSGEIDAELEANRIQADFMNRVGAQIRLSQENDFEASRNGTMAMMALAQAVVEGRKNKDAAGGQEGSRTRLNLDELIASYNAGRAFQADKPPVEAIPDQFGIELIVDQAPPKNYLDWMQFKAGETKGVKARFMGLFRRIHVLAPQNDDEIFDRYLQTLPEYRQIVREGEEAARESRLGDEYNPANDPVLADFKARMMSLKDQKETGHSLIRMKAFKFGVPISAYSFMFGAVNNSGKTGTIVGRVDNPARVQGGEVRGDYKIKYPDYLRAAAKIRGTVGSMRSYSLMGYNSTSFAVEVAKAAGIPLNDEDTSSDLMNIRHRSQRVDSPYLMAQHLNEQIEKQKAGRSEADENREQNQARSRNEKREALFKAKRAELADRHKTILETIVKLGIMTETQEEEAIKTILYDVSDTGFDIDLANPEGDLTGDDLTKVRELRIKARMLIFGGEPTEDGRVEKLAEDKTLFTDLLLASRRRGQFITDSIGTELTLNDLKPMYDLLKGKPYFVTNYQSIPTGAERYTTATAMISAAIRKQASMRRGIEELLGSKEHWAEFIEALDEYMGQYKWDMLDERVFKDSEELTAFLQLAGIDSKGEAIKQEAESESTGESASASGNVETPIVSKTVETSDATLSKTAEKTSTDAQINDAKTEVDEAKSLSESATQLPSEPVNEDTPLIGNSPDQASKPKASTTQQAETTTTAMQVTATPMRLDHSDIKRMVFHMERDTAVDLFNRAFSMFYHRTGPYMAKKGKPLDRGHITKVLSVLSMENQVQNILKDHFITLLNAASEEAKTTEFERMIIELASSASSAGIDTAFGVAGLE